MVQSWRSISTKKFIIWWKLVNLRNIVAAVKIYFRTVLDFLKSFRFYLKIQIIKPLTLNRREEKEKKKKEKEKK